MSYLCRFVRESDGERFGGANQGLHCHKDVLVDQPRMLSPVLQRIALAVDDPHLLDKGRLARFTCA